MPDRLELIKGPPALRRAHLDQLVAALWPPRRTTPRVLARARAAQRAARADPRRARVRRRARRWDRELRGRRSRCATTARRPSPCSPSPFAARRAARPQREPTLEYRPRSRATDEDEFLAELQARLAVRPRARLLRTRPAPRRAGAPARPPRAARLRLAGRAAPGPARAAAGRARRARARTRAHAADAARRRDERARLQRRELLAAELAADGQSVIATTDLGHVPGAGDARVSACASRPGRSCRRRSQHEETVPPARCGALGRLAASSPGHHARPRAGGVAAAAGPAIAAAARPPASATACSRSAASPPCGRKS